MTEHNSTERGRVIWFSSDEDGGPDCGLSIGLGDGHALYIGELADKTLEDSGVDLADTGGCGWWITLETPTALSVIGPVVDMENAREMFDQLTAAFNCPATSGAGSGGIAAKEPKAPYAPNTSEDHEPLCECDVCSPHLAGGKR